MKFHRITLRDYKAIRSYTIEPRETGVTIIEGENEVGKSSIAEALWLVFEQNDDSASATVRNLKPAGRDASTEIEVEVSTGAYRFTYFKRFHKGSRTELRVTAPKPETLTGREAHNRARQILEETMDRALWEALRLQQGASLEPLNASQHQSLLQALDVAAGELLGGDREQTLYERVEQEYLRYWTSTGREKASGDGPNGPRLRKARDDARTEAERIAARIAALEERAVRSMELGDRITALAEQVETLKGRREELRQRDEERKALAAVVETAEARAGKLESETRRIGGLLKAREDAESAMVARAAACERQRVELEELTGPLAEARAALQAAESALAEADAAVASAARDAAAAEGLVRLSERELQATQMSERLARIESNEPELREVVAWLNACRVDRRALQEIAAAEREIDRIADLRDAEGASIEVSAPTEATIEIDGQQVRIGPGQVVRGKVPGETTLSLPGGIVVRVLAGAAARELEAAMTAAEATLAQRLAAAGVESAAEARDTWDRRIQNEERRKSLMEQIRADLRDLTTDALREKLERERTAIAAIREAAGGASPESLDAAKAAQERSVQEARGAQEAKERATTELREATGLVGRLERRQLELGASLKSAEAELARQDAELQRMRQEPDGQPLAEQLAAAREELGAENEKLAESRAALAQAVDASAELTALGAQLATIERGLQEARETRAQHAGVLEAAGAEGVQGQLVEAEQAETAASEELEAFERRAAAARRLYDTMTRRRDEARENYSEPLRREIEALGKRALGPSFGVELSEALQIARVTRDGVGLELGQLSVGLREQLAVLTRLACASLVSASDGAPVVLDDIFGWADPGRLEKLGPILADAARETQVLLFTCYPHRFDAVAPARVISLPSGAVVDRSEAADSTIVEVPQKAAQATSRLASAARPAAPQAAFDLFGEPETASSR
jgi:hypothetical protein